MSSAREYEGRLQFGRKLSRGGPFKMDMCMSSQQKDLVYTLHKKYLN